MGWDGIETRETAITALHFFSQDYGISVLDNYERRNLRKWMMMNPGSQQCISLYVTCNFRTLIGASGTQSDILCRECSRLLPD